MYSTLRLTLLGLLISTTVLSSPAAQARRYRIPSDANVMIEINNDNKYIEELNPDSITVFVWNMYKGDKPDWKKDYTRLSKNKDILLLQEVYLDYQMSSVFFQDDEVNYKIATSFVDTKKRNTPTGVGTASKVKPIDYFWQRSPDREPVIKTPKMTMFAEYPMAGTDKTVLTANIHAINFVSSRKLKNMLDEMEEALSRHDGPIIVGGDFNTWSKRKIRVLRNMAHRLGLTEVKFANDERMRTFGNIIDYVFVRDFKVVRSKVYGDVDGSDHKALEVELKLLKK